MNMFQKQLILNNGKTMAQDHNDSCSNINARNHPLDFPYGIELAPSEQKITVEEFENIFKRRNNNANTI